MRGRVKEKIGLADTEEGADADITSARGDEKLISYGLSSRRGMRTHQYQGSLQVQVRSKMGSTDAEGADANSTGRCEGFKWAQQTQMRAQIRSTRSAREVRGVGYLDTADAEEGADKNSTGSAREV